MQMMDYDTGGGEFLLSLNHPFDKTSATEGYAPNVSLCKERLLPLGIDFIECKNPHDISFHNHSFDLMINRHGDFAPMEIYRLLRKNGLFITEQVGEDNERDLVEMVLPGTKKPFPEFSVDKCFKPLLKMKEEIDRKGFVQGTIHRYLIVATK